MQNNKVCHLTSVHPPFDIRIFYKECVSLVKYGYSVTLIAPILNGTIKDNVAILPIKLPKSRLIRIPVVAFKMWVKALNVKADLYHFHDPELLLCGVLLKLSGKKVIFDVHENVRLSFKSKHWLPKFFVPVIELVYFLMERFCLLFFDALVFAEESYSKYYPAKINETVLNYPLPVKRFSSKKFSEDLKIIYVGGIHENRGIWQMLDLIEKLKQKGFKLHFDLVGQMWPANLRSNINDFLKDKKLEKEVKLHGRVDFKEVSDLIEKAHIGVSLIKPISNYKESLPTKIFEYMQHGLPVIANDFPLHKKYVELYNTGICIDINNIDMEVDKVVSLIKNKERMKEMGENGVNLTMDKWNWESQAEKLVHLYHKILN